MLTTIASIVLALFFLSAALVLAAFALGSEWAWLVQPDPDPQPSRLDRLDGVR